MFISFFVLWTGGMSNFAAPILSAGVNVLIVDRGEGWIVVAVWCLLQCGVCKWRCVVDFNYLITFREATVIIYLLASSVLLMIDFIATGNVKANTVQQMNNFVKTKQDSLFTFPQGTPAVD